MSKLTLQDRMDEVESLLSVISKDITEITQLLKNDTISQRSGKEVSNDSNNLEAIAAKIITDISDKMDKCECSKEILSYFKEKQTIDPIYKIIEENPRPTYRRYSPPNYMVGNPELGSSGNPNALKWPFGETPK